MWLVLHTHFEVYLCYCGEHLSDGRRKRPLGLELEIQTSWVGVYVAAWPIVPDDTSIKL